ncbi:MAG: hypothetical protein Q9168_004164, partial [Polycauliona sp. 1 TL-2023]
MEADERKNSTPTATGTSISRRRSHNQFPYLSNYKGPAPPDMAAILARQEENERRTSRRESQADAESTSSSLQSLDDDDDDDDDGGDQDEDVSMNETADVQPQKANAIPVNEEVSPLTRLTVEEQLPATVAEQPPPVGAQTSVSVTTPVSASVPAPGPLSIPAPGLIADFNGNMPFVFSQDDIERARENGRRLEASNIEAEHARSEKLVAAEDNLKKERLRTQGLTQEIEDLRKVQGECELKAAGIAHQAEGLNQIQSMYDEELKKVTAAETALAEEKARYTELEERSIGLVGESADRVKDLESQVKSLTHALAQAPNLEEADKTIEALTSELSRVQKQHSTATTQNDELQTQNADYRIKNGTLRKRQNEILEENATLKRKLADFTRDYGRPLRDHT